MDVQGEIRLRNKQRSSWEKKEVQRKGKGVESVSRDEYDFGGVPDEELDPCVYYEYARESRRIIHSVEEFREELRQLPAWKAKPGSHHEVSFKFLAHDSSQIRGTRFDRNFFMAVAQAADFPTANWQKLTARVKRNFSQFSELAKTDHADDIKSKRPPLVVEADQNNCDFENLSLSTWAAQKVKERYGEIPDQMRQSLLLRGFFIVDLSQPPPMIEQEFANWLTKHHPKGTEGPPELRGRKSFRDKLNALGAMRLKFYAGSFNNAQDKIASLPKRDTKRYFSYSDLRSWDRASERAFRHFRELLGNHQADLPIHYSKSWRK